MNSINLYNNISDECSKLITQRYSTSFTLGIKMLAKKFHNPIYGIYGFVRLADEIVDTFHDYDKKALLTEFVEQTDKALATGISTNPVLQAFKNVVHQYDIPKNLIDAFLDSMEMDLQEKTYSDNKYNEYIYGSAEVVGLMCLRVFVEGDNEMYKMLEPNAKSLGSAFQKVNFLRDMKSDFEERGRVYFPGVDFVMFNQEMKATVEADIQKDFDHALIGLMKLPVGARFGVYTAYKYYLKLFNKIKSASPEIVKEERIRIANSQKMAILAKALVRHNLNLL